MAKKNAEGGNGALIISGACNQEKFFSNGLDFEAAMRTPYFFTNVLNPFWARVLAFPMPTIAAINGHAFAGGWLLALCCDFRVMIDGTKRRAWACMNEIHFGAPLTRGLATILKCKLSPPHLLRRFALEGHRFTPQELLDSSMVEALGNSTEDVLTKAKELAEKHGANARTGTWGLIKKDIYSEVFEALSLNLRTVMPDEADRVALAKL